VPGFPEGRHVYRGRFPDSFRYYEFPDVPGAQFVGITTALKTFGDGIENLIKWGVKKGREEALDKVATTYRDGMGIAELVGTVRADLSSSRPDRRAKEKAGDIGKAAHDKLHWWLSRELGISDDPEPVIPDDVAQAEWAFMAGQDWFKSSGLRPMAMEQSVYDRDLMVAGTFDLLAWDPKRGPGLIDYKSSSGVYNPHHVQLAQYLKMVRGWLPVTWGKLVRLPKDTKETAVTVVDLGQLYRGRVVSEEQLLYAFRAALYLYRTFVEPPA
jgi:hypothetical protein